MKLTAIIPSRGRPERLVEVVAYLQFLSSGNHEINYVVGADSDDPKTIETAFSLPVTTRIFEPRLGSLGQMFNWISSEYPADAYLALADDLGILTQHWDDNLCRAWTIRPDGVWWWHTPNKAQYAVVSEKWRAAAGRMFPDYFPFWWDDCWLKALWQYASGMTNLVGFGSWLNDAGTATHRMRDLQFWTDFYWAVHDERIEEADRIRQALGWPAVQHTFREAPAPDFNPEAIEKAQGDLGPPTPEYLAVRARAAAILQRKTAPVGSAV